MRDDLPIPGALNRFLNISQAVSVVVLVSLVAALAARLEWHGVRALDLFWQTGIALLPMVLLVAPQFWRRICPFAVLTIGAAKQRQERSGIVSRLPRAITVWIKRYGIVTAAAIFWIVAPLRLLVFNQSARATAILIVALATAALLLGAAGPWKALWCCSLCPVYPIEKFYGAAPLWVMPDPRCVPKDIPLNCYRCALHCLDVPRSETGYWKAMERASSKPIAERMRRFFVGSFPGFVLAYWLLAREKIYTAHQGIFAYGMFLFLMFASYVCYQLAKTFFAAERVDLAAVVLAFNLHYFGASSAMSVTFARLAGLSATFAAGQRYVIIALASLISIIWFRRAYKIGPGPWTRW